MSILSSSTLIAVADVVAITEGVVRHWMVAAVVWAAAPEVLATAADGVGRAGIDVFGLVPSMWMSIVWLLSGALKDWSINV